MKRSRLEDAIFSDEDDEENEEGGRIGHEEKQQQEKSKEKLKNGVKDGELKGGEELLIKKRKMRRQVTESELAGDDGILRIYEEFPRLCRFRGRGYEVDSTVPSHSPLLLTLHPSAYPIGSPGSGSEVFGQRLQRVELPTLPFHRLRRCHRQSLYSGNES
jgi:hypothetical protein